MRARLLWMAGAIIDKPPGSVSSQKPKLQGC